MGGHLPDENEKLAEEENELELVSSEDLLKELSRRSECMVYFSRTGMTPAEYNFAYMFHGDSYVCLTMTRLVADVLAKSIGRIFDDARPL